MKYVALLSGGKDSCYNLLHCQRNGHQLVSAASLGPEPGKEELDSYMYQTVGQDAIELVARALDVPLYRRVISGHALEQGSEYGARNSASGTVGDETEDLYALLSTVKSKHPDIEGVSVGAILSNYQRVRVEHVCRRLSLTPLCYLWQRDQGELMTEMIEAGMEAILIKVAGIGLTVKHLGNTLAQMEPIFIKLNNLYGAHICGEGGEYETLTVDCPLFKHRIVLTEVETVIHSDSDFATVAYLRIKNATLQPKSITTQPVFHIPEVLEEKFASIRDHITSLEVQEDSIDTRSQPSQPSNIAGSSARSKQLSSWIAVSNVHSWESGGSVEDEVTRCFRVLQEELAQYSVELSDCTNINIFLSSMDLFSSVNAVYSTFFGTSPPARACVAVDLPAPCRVMLDCIAHSRTTERHALHVQSLSYWAPANIGPYSQAAMIDDKVFISGQIGLIPRSLSLPSPQSLAFETALSLQHVNRVTQALGTNTGGWAGHTQLAIYWLANASHLPAVLQGHSTFESKSTTPTLFLVVEHLPKNALVEKQVLLHTGRIAIPDEDDDDELVVQNRTPAFQQGDHLDIFHWEVSWFDDSNSSCAVICGRDGGDYWWSFKSPGNNACLGEAHSLKEALRSERGFNSVWARTLSVRVFYVPLRVLSFFSLCERLFETPQPPMTFIPCRNIASQGRDGWDYAICILTV
ncbi:Diphthine--ammonia ligase [Mycena venus]|uniref:Diphthine--ammonia ligase n=1 Tax=Mycena venus TaxID=2733690 RepID=A0A8H6Y691_9AGAR|nr:Diphthine--ammonia ligase [Mycena venus]